MPDVITWKKNDMAQSLDEYFYLVGDEDTNVGLQCKSCDRGGLPVVYYTTNPKDDSYKDDDVVIVNSIQELVDQGSLHMLEHQR